jgi:hypothetical protein
MKLKWMIGTMVVVAAVSAAAVGAQSGQSMNKPADKMMTDKMTSTYTGCVVSIDNGKAFQLTQIEQDDMKGMKDAKDTKGTKKMNDMKGDGMAMKHDTMWTPTLTLTGLSDLKKHAGQKVTVTGTLTAESSGVMPDDPQILTVTSLKVIAKSCPKM